MASRFAAAWRKEHGSIGWVRQRHVPSGVNAESPDSLVWGRDFLLWSSSRMPANRKYVFVLEHVTAFNIQHIRMVVKEMSQGHQVDM
jgi:hypothetical protein